jgi:hypothetical protein
MSPAGSSAGRKQVVKEREKSLPAASPRLKPQKKLLIILSVALAVWVAWLIVLYAQTVYPMRHGRYPSTESQEIETEGR